MTLILNGSVGVSDVDGSAATPAIRGTDANTGMFFPAADTIAFAAGGVEAMRLDSAGNLGIGTTTPNAVSGFSSVTTNGSTGGLFDVNVSGTLTGRFYATSTATFVGSVISQPLVFYTAGNERMRIDSSGNLLVGTTSYAAGQNAIKLNGTSSNFSRNTTSAISHIYFENPNGTVGQIQTSGSSTSYITSSDYRLKEDVQLLASGIETISAIRPVSYKWKVDGSTGHGFIAHELQAIVPDAVSGEKDAVDTDGNPIHQGVDYSKIVVHLVAACQELKAQNDELKARVEALNV
jgi:hypothetical protein